MAVTRATRRQKFRSKLFDIHWKAQNTSAEKTEAETVIFQEEEKWNSDDRFEEPQEPIQD